MPAAPHHGLLSLSPAPPAQSLSAIVVGARTRRQGTGPFIAAGLAQAGIAIRGIVGTGTESVALARRELERGWGLQPAGFTDLDDALEALPDCAVAICSPWQVHAQQLLKVAAARRHCLVEKPLAWPASQAEADEIVGAFERRGLLLQVVNQWPASLPLFAALHGGLPQNIRRFTMGLSPISIGPDMVTDAAPHFIGLLQALAGQGECRNCLVEHRDQARGDQQQLFLRCDYEHVRGSIAAELILKTCPERPRPAWYQINELRVDREVELPHYRQYLVADGRRQPLPDPLQAVTADFARALLQNASTEGDVLRSCHRNLLQLADACG